MSRTNARKPGWRSVFLKKLEETAIVALAARAAGVSRANAYATRARNHTFARQWEESLAVAVDMLEAKAHQLAFQGVQEPIYWKGEQVGARMNYHTDLIKFLLSGHRPEKYRQNHAVAHSGDVAPPGRVEVVLVKEPDGA